MTTHWVQYNSHLPLCMCLILPPACHGENPVIGSPDEPGATESSTQPDPSDSTEVDGPGDVPTEPTSGTSSGETSTGVDSSTGADASTGEATSTSGVSYCGDGVLDEGEECDYGPGNSNFAFCTEACALNVCGDGFVLVDVELCDDGPANSDLYGSTCGSQCAPAARCGDGLLQEAEEECDLGPGNETEETNEDGLKCTQMCRLDAYRGFVTDAMFTGDLGGLEGADAKCKDAAKTAGFATWGSYRAFISGVDLSANQRFEDRIGDPTPYLLPGGQMFAKSYDDLITSGPGDFGIHQTEYGESILGASVLTNTDAHGEMIDAAESCLSWKKAEKGYFARIGYNAFAQDQADYPTWKAQSWWTNADVRTCDKTYFHLYCLE